MASDPAAMMTEIATRVADHHGLRQGHSQRWGADWLAMSTPPSYPRRVVVTPLG